MTTNATNATQYFGFPLFVNGDKPSWLTDWNGTVEELDNILESYRLRIAATEQGMEGFMDQVNAIREAIAGVNARLDGDETSISEIVVSIANFNDLLLQTDTSVKALLTRMSTAETNISTLTSDMNAAETNITSLQERMTTAESNITSLQTLTARLRALVINVIGSTQEISDFLGTEWVLDTDYAKGDIVYRYTVDPNYGVAILSKIYECLEANHSTAQNKPGSEGGGIYWRTASDQIKAIYNAIAEVVSDMDSLSGDVSDLETAMASKADQSSLAGVKSSVYNNVSGLFGNILRFYSLFMPVITQNYANKDASDRGLKEYFYGDRLYDNTVPFAIVVYLQGRQEMNEGGDYTPALIMGYVMKEYIDPTESVYDIIRNHATLIFETVDESGVFNNILLGSFLRVNSQGYFYITYNDADARGIATYWHDFYKQTSDMHGNMVLNGAMTDIIPRVDMFSWILQPWLSDYATAQSVTNLSNTVSGMQTDVNALNSDKTTRDKTVTNRSAEFNNNSVRGYIHDILVPHIYVSSTQAGTVINVEGALANQGYTNSAIIIGITVVNDKSDDDSGLTVAVQYSGSTSGSKLYPKMTVGGNGIGVKDLLNNIYSHDYSVHDLIVDPSNGVITVMSNTAIPFMGYLGANDNVYLKVIEANI